MTKPPSQSDPEDAHVELQAGFGASVRAARKILGLKQDELAAQSGITQAEISKIERGMTNVTLRTMSRLARVLQMDVKAVLEPPKSSQK